MTVGRDATVRLILGALALVLACGGRAAAQEYCVACSEPTAVYRCVIENAQPRGGQPLQMLCISAMAKAGNHATCAIKRGTVFECDGPVKRVPWTASGVPQPQEVAPATATKSPPGEPPKTMVDMAKRANEQTAEQMKKAGEDAKSFNEKLGTTTKKTWDCMLSLFTRC